MRLLRVVYLIFSLIRSKSSARCCNEWLNQLNIISLMKNISLIFMIVFLGNCTSNPHEQTISWNGEKPFGHVLSLNGEWQLEDGNGNQPPDTFTRIVNVPGIVKNAYPPFEQVGLKTEKREVYWYRKKVDLPDYEFEKARLIIGKSRYGTTVYLNGKEVGSNMLNHTAGTFDVTGYLIKEGTNELLVRLGAHISDAPDTVTTAGEVEKERYYAGIYDDVELVLSSASNVNNVQVVPDIKANKVGVEVEWEHQGQNEEIEYEVTIYNNEGNLVSSQFQTSALGKGNIKNDFFEIPIPEPTLWTPENPNLYLLQVEKEGEVYQTRFGMRTFRVDPDFTNKALLNEEQIFLRGTNVSLFRFFEDTLCKQQPWDRDWVVELHKRFKAMHWNSYRVCITALPDFWYDIADEMGFVLFDEYPMWYALQNEMASPESQQKNLADPIRRYGVYPQKLKAEHLANEYTHWMREHWNHASVCLWDAQNETWTPETGKAIQMVRHLDKSNRPWDNGWSPPVQKGDYREAHNYYARYNVGSEQQKTQADLPEPFKLSDLPEKDKIGFTFYFPYQAFYEGGQYDAYWDFPCVLNEYGYLWLNRDGTPTTLTKPYYDAVLGKDAAPEERFYHYARMQAALTEFWRSSRTMFGVLSVFGLSFSSDYAATGDMFVDVDRLTYYPYFKEYVADAFNPLGISIDFWEQEIPVKSSSWPPVQGIEIPVLITNDRLSDKSGYIEVSLKDTSVDSILIQEKYAFEVAASGQRRVISKIAKPEKEGFYLLSAKLIAEGEPEVVSYRDIQFK